VLSADTEATNAIENSPLPNALSDPSCNSAVVDIHAAGECVVSGQCLDASPGLRELERSGAAAVLNEAGKRAASARAIEEVSVASVSVVLSMVPLPVMPLMRLVVCVQISTCHSKRQSPDWRLPAGRASGTANCTVPVGNRGRAGVIIGERQGVSVPAPVLGQTGSAGDLSARR
jgi:hypothetical protein